MNSILDYWPFEYEPRQNQITAFEWLQEQNAKYLLLEAPVGSGKSNIGVTYSMFLNQRSEKHRGDSFILTPQRILQEQYERSFQGVGKVNLVSFYGKSNYTCSQKKTTCEVGSIVKPKCIACPFKIAKEAARGAANTVLNYKLALTSFAFTNTFNKRTLLVLDECHTLENHLVDFDALQISLWRCKKYGVKFKIIKTIEDALDWITQHYLKDISVALGKLADEIEPLLDKSGEDLTRAEIKRLREYGNLADHVDEVMQMSKRSPEYVKEKFVLVWDKQMFQFKRLTGAYSFHKIVNPRADKFLFMSSTILNKEGFCRDLAIPAEDTAFLSLGSDFPVKNRPVFFMPQMKMNASWAKPENSFGRDKMLDSVIRLLEMHKGETGIIHTANYAIAEWLVEQLSSSPRMKHVIYHHNPESGDDRNAVIMAFLGEPKPSVLISPSSTEGLDLKDDLGRFAIFIKVPFGYLGDQWIRRRMELSSEWYQRRALIDMIQGGGRIVRSKTDEGTVYILDGSFGFLFSQTFYMIPKWWKESYQAV